jgi:hypothetical protein
MGIEQECVYNLLESLFGLRLGQAGSGINGICELDFFDSVVLGLVPCRRCMARLARWDLLKLM